MAKRPYVVVVTEVSKRRVVVWAGGTADAEEAARDLWDTSEIILDESDFVDNAFECDHEGDRARPGALPAIRKGGIAVVEEKVLDAIRRMVIHGLYKTALTYGYGAEVFRAFKAEQVRLFDNLEENIKRLQAAGLWSEKSEENIKALQAAETWRDSKWQDYQSEQKDTKRKVLGRDRNKGGVKYIESHPLPVVSCSVEILDEARGTRNPENNGGYEMSKYLFTSESVTEGHPDKVCDRISDAVLDEVMAHDPNGRVACEVCCTTGMVMVMGEITTEHFIDFAGIARSTLKEIGYDSPEAGFDGNTCAVMVAIDEQSPGHRHGDQRQGRWSGRPGDDVRLCLQGDTGLHAAPDHSGQ